MKLETGHEGAALPESTRDSPAEPDARPLPVEPRAFCYRCQKPERLCLCGVIPRIAHRTKVMVLQHPRERAHPIGTARFVELGLERGEVVVAHGLRRALSLPPRTAVLYPHASARDLAELAPSERPEALVVLDGTWPQARTLYRQNPWLADLPHVRLSPDAPSRYRIRREPREDYVSTLESIVLALRILEPEAAGLESLLAAFDTMIDAQIASHGGSRGPRRVRRRGSRDFVGVPRALGEDHDALVIVYPEFSRPARAGASRGSVLVQWTAVRPSTLECFERLVRPEPPLSPEEYAGTGISPSMVENGTTPERALEELRSFVGERAIVAGASPRTTDRLSRTLGAVESLSLRAAYRALRPGPAGTLEAIVAREHIAVSPLPFAGRAATRMGCAVAVAAWLRTHSRERAEERRAEDEASDALRDPTGSA